MQCERCEFWFCIKCLKIEAKAYDSLNLLPDVHWYCKDCERKAVEAVKVDKTIEEKCEAFFKRVKDKMADLEESLLAKADKAEIDNIDSKVLALESKLKGVSADVSTLARRQELQESEATEKIKRAKNLILKGIPENDTPDIDKVNELLQALQFQPDDVEKVNGRLGKRREDGSPRFIKVECKDEDVKKKILSKASQIRNVPNLSFEKKTVYI